MLILALICLAAMAVPFTIYPLMLWLHARLAADTALKADMFPHVDLIICAHNEADHIAAKMQNVEALNYPKDKLSVWVASDGSSDATVEIASASAADNVTVLDLPRTGKAGALDTAVTSGTAPVIAFSDANSDWEVDALKNLTAYLADDATGGVAGDQRYGTGKHAAGERSYWSFDRKLKEWQAQAGSAISATGAIYCIRREFYQPPPGDATDDFMISTGVIAAGRRLQFAPDAVAWEAAAEDGTHEFARKVRIISRGLRSIYYRRQLLNPFKTGIYGLELLVHKVWRRMVWLPLLCLVILSPALLFSSPAAVVIAIGTIGFVALGLAGAIPGVARSFKPAGIANYVWMVNFACAKATFNFFAGHRISHWNLPRSDKLGG